jgi:hypothetical protein
MGMAANARIPTACSAQFRGIPHTTVNHNTGPTVTCRRSPEVATQQGLAQRATTVHNQHLANPALLGIDVTGGIHGSLDQRVVLKTLHGFHRSVELFHPAKVLENGCQNPEFASGVILVGVTQITGCKVNRHGPSLLFSKYDHSPMKKTTFPNEKVIFSLDMPHFLQ